MRISTRLLLLSFELLTVVAVIYMAVEVQNGMEFATTRQISNEKEYFTDVELGDLSDLSGQTLVGTEVKNLIKKYLDPYSIRIVDGDTDKVYADKQSAVGAVESTALYSCLLMEKGVNGEYQVTTRADRAIRISFTRETEEPVTETLDYTGLAGAIGWTGSMPTQDFLDTAGDTIVALKNQNALLAQHNTFQVSSGTVLPQTRNALDFVPTDLIVKSSSGSTGYLNLNGTTDAAVPATSDKKELELFAGVSVVLEYEDDTLVKCTIINEGQEALSYKSLQIYEN